MLDAIIRKYFTNVKQCVFCLLTGADG